MFVMAKNLANWLRFDRIITQISQSSLFDTLCSYIIAEMTLGNGLIMCNWWANS